MKMARITITVHTAKDATWTEDQYNELHSVIQDWAKCYVRNVLQADDELPTVTNPEVTLDNFVNDIELPSGPVADALSKENTTITITVK